MFEDFRLSPGSPQTLELPLLAPVKEMFIQLSQAVVCGVAELDCIILSFFSNIFAPNVMGWAKYWKHISNEVGYSGTKNRQQMYNRNSYNNIYS